jgi:hypothetical protein
MKFFAFFFGEKNGLQKFHGKFYVLASRLSVMIIGIPLQNSFVALVSLNFDAVNPISRWGLGRFVLGICMEGLRGFYIVWI